MRVMAIVVLVLAGCTNTKDPVLVSDVCTRGHSESYTYNTFIMAGKTMVPVVHSGTRFECDHYMHIVSPNPDYKPQPITRGS